MSKAEEKSKQYKDFREQCGIKDPVMLNEIEEAYYEGYHQAEKDLELTWEDFKFIHKITYETSRNVALNRGGYISEKEFYQEGLKRFKEQRDENTD